jgi:hypothetical protein
MQIKTTKQVNARTQDGRVYAAGEGSISEFDDDDAGMIGLAKSLIASGQAEHYGDAGSVDEDELTEFEPDEVISDEPDTEVDPEAELAQLRELAEDAGVKVDGRWGAERLREEIANAAADAEASDLEATDPE